MGAIKDPRYCNRHDCFAYRSGGQCDCLRSTTPEWVRTCPFFKTYDQNEEVKRRCKERLPTVDWNDAVHQRMIRLSRLLRVQEELGDE